MRVSGDHIFANCCGERLMPSLTPCNPDGKCISQNRGALNWVGHRKLELLTHSARGSRGPPTSDQDPIHRVFAL